MNFIAEMQILKRKNSTLQAENEKQRIEIEFLKGQLSKYLSEPETHTSGTAEEK